MFPVLHFSLTVSKLALFKHLTEALAEFVVALVLGTIDELFELIGAGLLLLRGLLLVHGLWLLLVRLLKDTRHMMGSFTRVLYIWYFMSKFVLMRDNCNTRFYVNINLFQFTH